MRQEVLAASHHTVHAVHEGTTAHDLDGHAGTLPGAWAAQGLGPNLKELVLGANALTGTLPSDWAGEGLAKLRLLDLSRYAPAFICNFRGTDSVC